jgi:hypothetical protein
MYEGKEEVRLVKEKDKIENEPKMLEKTFIVGFPTRLGGEKVHCKTRDK